MIKIFFRKINLLIVSILTLGLLVINDSVIAQQKVVGYYESWVNLPSPDKIEFKNLTHIVQAFASPNVDGSISLPEGIPNPGLVNAVHSANEKILLSFGGAGNSDGFVSMTSNASSLDNFVSNVAFFLFINHYDGIDIDWEFPTFRQGGQLTALVKALRIKFNSINPSWLITMAIPADEYYGQNFQYEKMVKYVDWFSIMSYDYNGSWTGHAAHNAPLYEAPGDNAGACFTSVQYLKVTRKIPTNKLLLGVPFYGKEFNASGLYQPSSGDVSDLAYSDILDTVALGGWIYYWDSVSEVPYYLSSNSTKFITFDDTTSIRLKTEFSISQHLGGIMIWALDQDMVGSDQPLLKTIGQTLSNNQPPPIVTSFYFEDNYPNPFNSLTTIEFSIPENGFVSLKVYDILGRLVQTLVSGQRAAGVYKVPFDGSKYSSGVYFYNLNFNVFSKINENHPPFVEFNETKKMILLK